MAGRARQIKKGDGLLREGVAVKNAFIERWRFDHEIRTLCKVLEVSKSGLYEWCMRKKSPRKDLLPLEFAARTAHERGRQT